MRNLLNPKWLIALNTIPIVVLFIIYINEYTIIKSLLTVENINTWIVFGSILGSLVTINLVYAIVLILKKKEVSAIYGGLALLCYISFLYLYGFHVNDIIPFTIPRWMVSNFMIIYVGTFLMPTIAYSLFVLVLRFTPDRNEPKLWKNFLYALAIPIGWYLFTVIIFPLFKPVDSAYTIHVIIVAVIIGTLVFLFYLIRGLYLLVQSKSELFKKYHLVWKIPFTLLFPLIGLLANNGYLYYVTRFHDSGIFGDFHNKWFYILAA